MIFISLFPVTDPTWIFLGVLCIVLFAPLLFNKLRMPHIIGMILAGLLIGPNGLNILERDSSFELFGKVGLYYIMFLASLEVNMQEMKQSRNGALLMGLAVFAIPILLGLGANIFILKYDFIASLLLASMYASYTLISYPIVARYGLSRLRCVNFVVGGAMITDTLTLFVLAIIAGTFTGEADAWFVVFMLLKLLAIAAIIIFLFPRIARYFFRNYNDSVIQYIFVMVMLFLGAGMMELAGMEGIRYRKQELQLEKGDTLYLYTDGVTEAANIENALFGEERLQNVLNENRDGSPEELLKAVTASLQDFVGEAAQSDDITMLALQYKGDMLL